MESNTYCPVSGLELKLLYNKKISKHYRIEFTQLGKSILHSLPVGYSEIDDVREALKQNEKIAEEMYKQSGCFIQIEDYSLLEGSSTASRKYYTRHLNKSKYLTELIFCNLKPTNSIAVKIGQRFLSGNTQIYVVKNYEEAVLKAFSLVEKKKKTPVLSNNGIMAKEIGKTGISEPVNFLSNPLFEIAADDYTCHSVIINNSIIHSVSSGILAYNDVEKLNRMRESYGRFLEPENKIDYVIVNDSGYIRSDSRTRKHFIESIKEWHKKTGFKLYILYGTNAFMKAVIHMTKSFLPFKIILVKSLTEAFEIINKDRNGINHEQITGEDAAHNEDVENLLSYLADIKWNENGVLPEQIKNRDESFKVLFQAIRLIKEEIDSLFKEREEQHRELEQALIEKQNLLKELQHRVKNSFTMISSMVKIKQMSEPSDETSKTLNDLLSRISAVSEMYELLNDTESIQIVHLNVYLMRLVSRFQQAAPMISFNCHMEPVNLSADSAVPAGLILSELITNSLKHAFPNGKSGEIEIKLISTGDDITLFYKDNGPGMPEKQHYSEKINSQGRQLMKSLCRQLEAKSSYINRDGLEYTLKFKS